MFVVYQHNINVSRKERKKNDTKESRCMCIHVRSLYRVNWMVRDGQ
jgi:hypothetical protein